MRQVIPEPAQRAHRIAQILLSEGAALKIYPRTSHSRGYGSLAPPKGFGVAESARAARASTEAETRIPRTRLAQNLPKPSREKVQRTEGQFRLLILDLLLPEVMSLQH